jgi:hypothetical protein
MMAEYGVYHSTQPTPTIKPICAGVRLETNHCQQMRCQVNDWLTNLGVGAGAAVAGAYAMYRKVLADNREGRMNQATDAATQQVIQMLREEVERLSQRLAAVEEQNRKCEEANDALREEIIAMKKQLHLF